MKFTWPGSAVLSMLILLGPAATARSQEIKPQAVAPAWEDVSAVTCDGLKVTLSKPRLVARSQGFLWFPTLHQFDDGQLVAMMSNHADVHREVDLPAGTIARSSDGGLTWSAPQQVPYSDCAVHLPSGDSVLVPYYLRFESDELLTGPYQRAKRGEKLWHAEREGVRVTGWPRRVGTLDTEWGAVKAEWRLGGFVFNGQSLRSKDGQTSLAMLYGRFAGVKRYSLVLAESTDALQWKILSVVADETCKLDGAEGPCESAIVRLKDGRLFCIFRLGSTKPYGQCFSDDDGRTWSESTAMEGPYSVQPSLALSSRGVLALSGGRPDLRVWLNQKGDARHWEGIDLSAHHDKHVPQEPVAMTPSSDGNGKIAHTSSYTEVRWIDDRHFLVIYDRLGNGWRAIPTGTEQTNSVWVVRGAVEAKDKR